MQKSKLSICLIFVLLMGTSVKARSRNVVEEDFEIGHISGRQSVIIQGGLTVFKLLGGRGVLSYGYAHSTFFQSRPFLSFGGFLKEYPNIALGYNMGFSLVDNGKNFCIRILTGPGGMMGFPKRNVDFNLFLIGEIEMEISLGSSVDLLAGGGGRYIFFKSRLGQLMTHVTVGLKFNF